MSLHFTFHDFFANYKSFLVNEKTSLEIKRLQQFIHAGCLLYREVSPPKYSRRLYLPYPFMVWSSFMSLTEWYDGPSIYIFKRYCTGVGTVLVVFTVYR